MPARYPPHIRQLRANVKGLKDMGRRHRKMCARCANAHVVRKPELGCDIGWEIEKNYWRNVRALQRAGQPGLVMAGDQLALF